MSSLPGAAQTVDFGVLKEHGQVQFSNAAPVDVTVTNGDPLDGGNNPGPYFITGFDKVTPDGTTSTVTTPSNSRALTWDPSDSRQEIYSNGYASESALDAAFVNGTYSIASTAGSSGPLTVGSTSYPTLPQVLTVNGGTPTWSNGDLVLDASPGVANTITWTQDANWSNSVGSHSDFELFPLTGGQSFDIDSSVFALANASSTPLDTYTYTIAAGTLVSGDTYQGIIDYTQLTSESGSSSGYNVAGDQNDLYFTVQAVPEPSSRWLLIVGLAGFAFWFRREIRDALR